MKTTPLSSVEERVKTICDCRKGSMDDKQYKATVEYNLTQDRDQAYTRLVEGIEGMRKDIPGLQSNFHEPVIIRNKALTYILENVVKPLYGKE